MLDSRQNEVYLTTLGDRPGKLNTRRVLKKSIKHKDKSEDQHEKLTSGYRKLSLYNAERSVPMRAGTIHQSSYNAKNRK